MLPELLSEAYLATYLGKSVKWLRRIDDSILKTDGAHAQFLVRVRPGSGETP
jgi:hypothetical protein